MTGSVIKVINLSGNPYALPLSREARVKSGPVS